MKSSLFDATISEYDVETSARPQWRYRHVVSANISDCGVGINAQMCNRVTNLGDMGTFSGSAIGDSTGADADRSVAH